MNIKAPETYKEYDKKGMRLWPDEIKDLYGRIDTLKAELCEAKARIKDLEEQVLVYRGYKARP